MAGSRRPTSARVVRRHRRGGAGSVGTTGVRPSVGPSPVKTGTGSKGVCPDDAVGPEGRVMRKASLETRAGATLPTEADVLPFQWGATQARPPHSRDDSSPFHARRVPIELLFDPEGGLTQICDGSPNPTRHD